MTSKVFEIACEANNQDSMLNALEIILKKLNIRFSHCTLDLEDQVVVSMWFRTDEEYANL